MATTTGPAPEGRVLVPDVWGQDAASPRVPRVPSPLEAAAGLLRGRYTALVIWRLFWGGKRFYQLVRELEGVPRQAIAHELLELENAGVLKRAVGGGPGQVEYRLTPSGEALKIVVGAMYEWGLLFRPPARPATVASPASSDQVSQ